MMGFEKPRRKDQPLEKAGGSVERVGHAVDHDATDSRQPRGHRTPLPLPHLHTSCGDDSHYEITPTAFRKHATWRRKRRPVLSPPHSPRSPHYHVAERTTGCCKFSLSPRP
ncbi:hypothetical protein Hypma_009509 [Hypsizygus marmoreus]|uniref:Uncharacterized protein n=1 Tax=Hypsizygus marmoreus TaxID=39966 RepID=A0A369JTC5_HYPMA|nr:hypothetical protein Hypma_009509 [Hypsizygus marmoreus]